MAERTGVGNYCRLIRYEGEQLLKWLKDSNVGSIQCKGWHGIGRWRIAEYAAKKAMESHLFDVLIWVDLRKKDFSPRNVQMKIAESLGIQAPTKDTYDFEIANQIYQNLKARNFLLVAEIELGSQGLEGLVAFGVPDVQRRRSHVAISSKSFSKAVWVGQSSVTMECDRDLELTIDIRSGTSSASDVWDLFHEEATLAAHCLRNSRFFPPNVVMDCIMYLAFYFRLPKKEHFLKLCIAEEIISGEEMETEEVLLEAMDQLEGELMHRSILVSDDHPFIQLQSDIERELSYILTDIQHNFFIQDEDNQEWGTTKKMLLGCSNKIINFLPQAPKAPNLSTLVIGENVNVPLPPTFFQHMKGLRVLHLSGSPIESLPLSLSSLCNLRFLILKDCRNICSLPTSLRSLEKLEFLEIKRCTSLKMIPEESFDLMGRLQHLGLFGNIIMSLPSSVSNLHNLRQLLLHQCELLTKIPENCFEGTLNLQVLDLSYASSLESLPSSLSNLVSLKTLILQNCESLKTGVGLHSLQNLSLLEVLGISECNKLEDIRDVSFQHILPKLRDLNISDTPIPKRLLFRGFLSLENLNLKNLEHLEVLRLFGCTKLKALNIENRSYNSLKHLDILPMENFDKVIIFGKDERYKVPNWGEDDVGARIWVSNPDFFKSVLKVNEKIFQSECFSRFYIRISPYSEDQEDEWFMPRTMIKIQNIHLQRSRFVYEGIYHSQIHPLHLFPHSAAPYNRCLEISQGDSSPKGLDKFLAHTEFIILFNHSFIERLSPLWNAIELKHLKECQIRSCQGIETLFFASNRDFDILRSLEVIRASDLPKLVTVCSGVYGIESFTFLKHVFLQHCPRLVILFTSAVHLQSLETLEIGYCFKLEKVFGEEVEGREGSLPSLRNLYLFHVPKINNISYGCLPHLEMLQVHRCPMLRKLPIQVCKSEGSASSSPPDVEIRGELEWWNSLEWGIGNDHNKARVVRFQPWRHLLATTQKQH